MWKSLRQQVVRQNKFIYLFPEEKVKLVLKSLLAVIVVNVCFYQNILAFLGLWSIGIVFYEKEKRLVLSRKEEAAREQFREMLLLTVTGQRAGYSVENAFLNSYEDLANLYGAESSICKMLQEIREGIRNHIAIAELWKRIGEECDIVEIKEFAQVLEVAVQSGGRQASVLEKTADTIADKTDTKKEIAVVMSAKVLEQKVMNIMPFGLILYLNVTSPGYFEGLYHSVGGVFIMTGCLLFYLMAYFIGEKTARIEL